LDVKGEVPNIRNMSQDAKKGDSWGGGRRGGLMSVE